MLALVKTQPGNGSLELRDVPEPHPGPGELLIAVKAAGICGTDLHIEEGKFPTNPPVVIGHEFAGEVLACGPGVDGWKPGDRVACEPHRGGCGVCRHCLTGAVEVCSKKRAIGYRVDGCFTRLTWLPAASLHRIPDGVSFDQAALTEPLAVVVKAVLQRAVVEPGDFVAVLGCGPIGLLAAAAAKAAGAGQVLITGIDRDETVRLAAARAIGLDHAVNTQKTDLTAMVKDLTRGAGADLVVEATGVEAAIHQAFDILRIDGRVSGVGICGRDKVQVPWDLAMKKAAHIHFSYSSNWLSWERALGLLGSGAVRVDPLITHRFPLAEWRTAFALLRRGEAIKALLSMDGGAP